MAGGMGGGGGGGGGGSGSALGDQQPMAQTAGNDFSGNAMSPGGSPAQFVDNAMSGGGSPASVVGGQNDPASQAQMQGLYAYAGGGTPPSPTGTQSGQPPGFASGIQKIGEALFGSNKANASSLPNVAGRAPTASAGWPTREVTGGPGGGTDPYGNTYTTAPDYQGSVAHPLPPYRPSAAAAPATAPAPAPQETAQPKPAETGGGAVKPAEPTPEAATKPDQAANYIPPEMVPDIARQGPPPGQLTGGEIGAAAAGPEVSPGAAAAVGVPAAPAAQAPAPAQAPSEPPPQDPLSAYGLPGPDQPTEPAPVSPQSDTGSGNTPRGGWQADPNSAIGRLMRGDWSGAFNEAMRALTGQLGVPNEQNMIGRGTSTPALLATARGFMDPGGTQTLSGGAAGTGAAEIRAGDMLAGVPPDTASTARAFQVQNRDPRGTTGFTSIDKLAEPGAPAAAQPGGGAQAAPTPTQAAPQTVQERVQWRAAFENWRSANKLPDTPENRERFNAERGYPKGSSSAAPAKPAPGQAGAAPGQVERGPDPAGGGGTGMLNAIRARRGLPPLPPGSRLGAPPPQFAPPAEDKASVAAASNVGQHFPRGDWRQFMKEARPSTNVERSSGPPTARQQEQIPPAHWDMTPEETARYQRNFNPNDPMTRSLMGSDRAKMRSDILRSFTPAEMQLWMEEMRQQGYDRLKDPRPMSEP